jgi:ABC-type antimicrobial peptide transport system permease subunit
MAEVIAEAGLTGLVGGLAGLLVARGVLAIAASAADVSLSVGAGTTALALCAAAGTGVAAGWYPARKASRVDVIDALRQE